MRPSAKLLSSYLNTSQAANSLTNTLQSISHDYCYRK